MSIDLIVNGIARHLALDPEMPLLDALRNHLDLKGSRYGCGLEQCGACMVLVDGEPVYACARELGTVAGKRVETVESLDSHPLRAAFLEEQAGQCGYCLNGIQISAKALLDRTKHPTRAQIVGALDKHLCRCGTQWRIIRAVERAAAAMAAAPRVEGAAL